jgi:hypothetical protein
MKCSRCNGSDPNCYVCWEEPQEERDVHDEHVEEEMIKDANHD